MSSPGAFPVSSPQHGPDPAHLVIMNYNPLPLMGARKTYSELDHQQL